MILMGGWRFGQEVPDGQITRSADANFSVLTAFPSEPLDVSNDDFILWEQGGAGTGAFVGFKDGYLRIRAGTGGSSISVPEPRLQIWQYLMFPILISLQVDIPVASCMIFAGK